MKAGIAITLLLLSAFALAAHAGSDDRSSGNSGNNGNGGNNGNSGLRVSLSSLSSRFNSNINFKPVFEPVVTVTQITEYFCTYFYFDEGYCPSNWDQIMQLALTEYSRNSNDVLGCSLGDSYNFGLNSFPNSEGGYICFRFQTSIVQFWTWFYSSQYATGFAPVNSNFFHYQNLKQNNLPKLVYTY